MEACPVGEIPPGYDITALVTAAGQRHYIINNVYVTLHAPQTTRCSGYGFLFFTVLSQYFLGLAQSSVQSISLSPAPGVTKKGETWLRLLHHRSPAAEPKTSPLPQFSFLTC